MSRGALSNASREERENRTVLFPIRIDEAVMTAPQPWAADIRRTRHIGDSKGGKITTATRGHFSDYCAILRRHRRPGLSPAYSGLRRGIAARCARTWAGMTGRTAVVGFRCVVQAREQVDPSSRCSAELMPETAYAVRK